MNKLWLSVCILIASLLISLSLLTASASSAPLIVGDLTQDGVLNSADVRAMLRYMVGYGSLTAEQRLQADADGNTRIDTADARAVLAMIVWEQEPITVPTATTTVATTATTKPSLDDEGYYDDVIRP